MLKGLRATAAAVIAAGLLVAAIAAPAQAALKHYDGTVLGSGQDSFRIKTESGRKLKFEVDGRTHFERISGGLAGLNRGDRIEVGAKAAAGSLIARTVEPQGGHGGGGRRRRRRRQRRPSGPPLSRRGNAKGVSER